MFDNIREDAQRYKDNGGIRNIGFLISLIYRLGSFASRQFILIRIPLKILFFLLSRPVYALYHLEIPSGAQIGPGLFMIHPFNILIDESTVIGKNCSIFHGVTIGLGPRPGAPTIGNNVVLFTGACILGGITIGDKTEIGPHCVLTNSVKEKMIVVSPLPRALPQSLLRREQ